jgi:hypothetical protein
MNDTSCNGAAARLLAVVALTAVLAACNRGGDEQAAATAASAGTGTAADAAAPAAESPDDKRMANAVATGKVGAAVDLKYDVLAKPDVGQPFEVELALLPRLAADALEVEVTGIPGLTVVSGGTTRFEGVTAGERYVAKVLVQADAPGIYYANVVAKTITQVLTEARTFSVPLVVGAVPAAEKVEPARDASGEAIRSLPAEESGGPKPPAQGGSGQ